MIYCALILIASLPASCIVVGVLLIVITIAALLMCALKWREAAVLKKEVVELRDTMRMMRYEEANLSRMLHTVSKQPTAMPEDFATEEPAPIIDEEIIEEESAKTIEEEKTEEVAIVQDEIENEEKEEVYEKPIVEESIEEENVSEEESIIIEEPEIEEPTTEGITMEEETPVEILTEDTPEGKEEEEIIEEPIAGPETEESIAEEPIAEDSKEDPIEEFVEEVATVSVMKEYVDSKPRKQAINERRPAIPPTDLFAAWFEENDTIEPEEPQTTATTQKTIVAEPVSESEKETPIQASTPIEKIAPVEVLDTNEETTFSSVENDEINATEPSELSKEDERFRRKLERIVNARMRNPNLNIDVIASQFGMGRTNFYRKVRELMGMSPNDYLRKCRMERAAELLQSSDQYIGEICGMVGIPDAQYFSRVFKSYFGVPPSSYREQESE